MCAFRLRDGCFEPLGFRGQGLGAIGRLSGDATGIEATLEGQRRGAARGKATGAWPRA